MQVCTVASGKTARIASGNPLSPSTTATRMSSVPRFFNSFITRSQNLAPSFCSTHKPSTSLVPSERTPSAMWMALLRTRPSSLTFTRSASKNTSGYTASNGRFCQAATSSSTASVTVLTRSGETSMP